MFGRWWWVIAACALGSVILAARWVYGQPDEYVAEGSYIVRTEADRVSDLVRATETLARSDELLSTYAAIATSALIEDQARGTVADSGFDAERALATSAAVSEANVLFIGARDRDPETALAMALAVGAHTREYVRGLGDTYRLEVLDRPELPTRPVERGGAPTLAGVGMAGLIGGIGLALVAERRFPASPRRRLRHVIDPRSTAFTREYLEVRIDEELARAESGTHTFSLVVLRVVRRVVFEPDEFETVDPAEQDLIAIANALNSTLLDKDVLAYLGRGRFAAMLPYVDLDGAREVGHHWRQRATIALLHDRRSVDLVVQVGACEFVDGVGVGDVDAELIASELSADHVRGVDADA